MGTTQYTIQQLPKFPNTFIGRSYHLDEIQRLLSLPHTQLLTLYGPGGIGKTRLAVRSGELIHEHFKDGVYFVGLDAVVDASQVPLYIGQALGLKASPILNWATLVQQYLQERQLLLILDNLEQILDATIFIQELLATCPKLVILCTSREVLALSEEIEYPIDSLNRPNPKLFPRNEDLLKFDAIQLFVQKAKTVQPSFQLSQDNAEAVVKICQELEGLPLPIELAAARIKLFSPELIFEHISQNASLLSSKTRNITPRHQTIQNAIKWSYDLLSPEEQNFFQQIALFRSSFCLPAVEALCQAPSTMDLIESFMNKSLIIRDSELYGTPRYRMLKLIRDFGFNLLASNADQDIYKQKAANYYLHFLKDGERFLQGEHQQKQLATIEAEQENLKFFHDWLRQNQSASAAAFGVYFWKFHLRKGLHQEGLAMIEALLKLPELPSSTKASLFDGAGVLSQNLGFYQKAKSYFLQNLSLWEDLQESTQLVRSFNNIAWVEWRLGNYDETLNFSKKALELSQNLRDQNGIAKSLNNQAWGLHYQGHYLQAKKLQEEVLNIQQERKDGRGIAFARTNLAWSLSFLGEFDRAQQLLSDSISQFQELGDRQLVSFSQLVLCDLYYFNGDQKDSQQILEQECLPTFETIGDQWGIATTHFYLGRIAAQRGNGLAAAQHLQAATQLFHRTNDLYGNTQATFFLGKIATQKEQLDDAKALLKEALQMAYQLGAHHLLAEINYFNATLYVDTPKVLLLHIGLGKSHSVYLGDFLQNHYQKQEQALLKSLRFKVSTQEFFDDIQEYLSTYSLPAEISLVELKQFFQDLIINIQEKQKGSLEISEHPDPFVRKAIQIIQQELHHPQFDTQALCKQMDRSHSQVHRRIKSGTDRSISQLIRELRLKKALALLPNTNLNISTIAYECGFKDADYFHRVFKQAYGMSPGAYRKNQ